MKQIPLTQGQFALVDDADFEWLNQWKWCAQKARDTFRVVRNVRQPNGTRTTMFMHRLILGLTDPKIQGDHRNGDGLNNQRDNLRPATNQQNKHNQSMRSDNTSSVRGVSWDQRTGKWLAQIGVNGTNKCIGYFDNLKDAKQARLDAELKYHGQFSAALSRGAAA